MKSLTFKVLLLSCSLMLPVSQVTAAGVFEDEEELSFFQRNKTTILVTGAVLVGLLTGGAVYYYKGNEINNLATKFFVAEKFDGTDAEAYALVTDNNAYKKQEELNKKRLRLAENRVAEMQKEEAAATRKAQLEEEKEAKKDDKSQASTDTPATGTPTENKPVEPKAPESEATSDAAKEVVEAKTENKQ